VIGGEDVDGDVSALETVAGFAGARELDFELELSESGDESRERRRACSQVGDDVEVTRDAWRHAPLLAREQEHHLPSDERPVLGLAIGEVEQGAPELPLAACSVGSSITPDVPGDGRVGHALLSHSARRRRRSGRRR